jgi:lysophospholipid acyltransferase (LPLAT)-like uncharacterized protein
MKSFLSWLCAWLIRIPGYSVRLTMDDPAGAFHHPDREPYIVAFWHNRIALMPVFYERFARGRSVVTFISRSRDGQFITDVAARFNVKAVRGSSSRHGTAALLAAVHASRDPKEDIAITPDGPRGPRYQIHPGLIRLAQMTGRPIVTVTYSLKWKWVLKSWDRFQLPLPFSACYLVTSKPIFVPREATEDQLVSISQQVAEALGGD